MANLSLDLGYRWESGAMSDMDVLIELCGSRSAAMLMINKGTEDMTETSLAWKRAGETFDWILGLDTPNVPMRFELRAAGVDPLHM